MNANCVNVLNKTVSNVCKLDVIVKENTEDIEFLFKYADFNKKLLLSLLSNPVVFDTYLVKYEVSPKFAENYLLEYLLYSIINFLNTNYRENYYLLVKSIEDVPLPWRKYNIEVPSVIQISLIQPNVKEIIEIFDSIKTNTFTEFRPVLAYMDVKYGPINVHSLTIAILYYLVQNPELYYENIQQVPLPSSEFSESYKQLQSNVIIAQQNSLTDLVNKYKDLKLNVKNVIESVNTYIKKGYDAVWENYRIQSINNPFYPKPTIHDVYVSALDQFLFDNHLKILDNGDVIQYGNSKDIYRNQSVKLNEESLAEKSDNFTNYSVGLVDRFKMYNGNTETTNLVENTNSSELIEDQIRKIMELSDIDNNA